MNNNSKSQKEFTLFLGAIILVVKFILGEYR